MSVIAQVLIGLIVVAWIAASAGFMVLRRRITRENRQSMIDSGWEPATADMLTLMDGWHDFNVAMLTGFVAAPLVFLVLLYDLGGTFG